MNLVWVKNHGTKRRWHVATVGNPRRGCWAPTRCKKPREGIYVRRTRRTLPALREVCKDCLVNQGLVPQERQLLECHPDLSVELDRLMTIECLSEREAMAEIRGELWAKLGLRWAATNKIGAAVRRKRRKKRAA